jgi:uncharacterized protein YbjT (DUF2867 family)
MKFILTGATGLLATEVLRQALDDATIEQVLVLTRRASGFAHAKMREIVLQDFLDYSGLDLRDYDACIWCLGISQPETHGYAIAAATAMFAANRRRRFCFVRSDSADRAEEQRTFFARIKYRTERNLTALGGDAFVFTLASPVSDSVRSNSNDNSLVRKNHAVTMDVIGTTLR